jgi:hypothetical protein
LLGHRALWSPGGTIRRGGGGGCGRVEKLGVFRVGVVFIEEE